MAQPVARAGTAKATTRARERTRANSFFILSNFLSKNCFCFVPGISPGLALRPIWDFPVCTSRCYHIITPLSTPLLRFCNKLFRGVIFQPARLTPPRSRRRLWPCARRPRLHWQRWPACWQGQRLCALRRFPQGLSPRPSGNAGTSCRSL